MIQFLLVPDITNWVPAPEQLSVNRFHQLRWSLIITRKKFNQHNQRGVFIGFTSLLTNLLRKYDQSLLD